MMYLKVKIDGLLIPKGRLAKGPFKPICRDCAIYFSITALSPALNDHQGRNGLPVIPAS